MKKLFYLVFSIILVFSLVACGKEELNDDAKENSTTQKTEKYEQDFIEGDVNEIDQEDLQEYQNNNDFSKPLYLDIKDVDLGEKEMEQNIVEINVKDYGTIVVELDPKNAPITCANFKKLVSEGFYDGLTFHRIMKGFMIQGGDPLGNGMGGSEVSIKGEFFANGVKNEISHKRGVISMARSSDPDSGSSQFFICDANDEFLDGNYAAFGKVIEGLEVVDQIATDAKPIDDNGTIISEFQPVMESVKLRK